MNFDSTQLRTVSTVEFELMHSRRTSASQAARIEGVTSGGNVKPSPAIAGPTDANNTTVTNIFMVLNRPAIVLEQRVRLRR